LAVHDFAEMITAVAAIGAVLMSFWNNRRIQDVHVLINSRMDMLLKATGVASHAEGVEQGRKDAMKGE
jgi:hypothetical protein